jgi:hypothetical protein
MKSSANESAVLVEPPQAEIEDHDRDPRWRLAKRVVSSKSLSKSALLCKFLLYVCDRHLNGRESEITEQRIGVQVFGRPVGYNAADDNIVRNYARLLRRRLDEHFAGEGKNEELRISIPRGGYVPLFHRNMVDAGKPVTIPVAVEAQQQKPHAGLTPVTSSTTEEPPIVQEKKNFFSRYEKLALLNLSIAVLLCGSIVLYRQHLHGTAKAASQQMWRQLFTQEKDTFIVPSDSGFVILQNLTGNLIHLADYVNEKEIEESTSASGIAKQTLNELFSMRNTSVVDLNVVTKISNLPEVVPSRLIIRYARELRLDDLKNSNAILLGSTYSNPWVELFQKDMNFQFTYKPRGADSAILNKQPHANEQTTYQNTAGDSSHLTYAVIAFLPNLSGSGKILILEGLTMAGTQAASDLVMNESVMRPILEKASEGGQTLKSFELLVETRSVGDNAPQARIIASRFYFR